jgi:hypothetical protein
MVRRYSDLKKMPALKGNNLSFSFKGNGQTLVGPEKTRVLKRKKFAFPDNQSTNNQVNY